MSNLKSINFTNGVRSEDIQHNFIEIDESIKRERLRAAGWGVVEGFNLTALDDFQIKIGPGVFIDKKGEEINIPETIIGIRPPETFQYTETVIVDNQGNFKLSFIPYIDDKKGYLTYDYYQSKYPINKSFLMVNANDVTQKIKALDINHDVITVDAARFANSKITVSYYYSNDRIDCILLESDGTYSVKQGISSTSPSVIDYGDYETEYSIGYAKITMGDTATVSVSEIPRSLRPVYVDSNDILYLNGKKYTTPKFIYFIEPANPEENDLWYDKENDALMIWELKDGVWGWRVINEKLSVAKKERKMWTIDKCPEDCQTFKFDDDEVNLRFIPGNNELEVIIDNAPLMSDQFTELIMENSDKISYLDTGVGFKLIEPLDRATCVECYVLHSVQLQPIRSTFQRAAVFVDENYSLQETANVNQIFKTDDAYIVNDNQMEVFVDGLKLTKELEWVEMVDENTETIKSDNNKASNYFKVKKPLTTGQVVSYRIERHVWSYDQLNMLIEELEKKADDALVKCADLQEQITNMNENTSQNLLSLTNTINNVAQKANEVDSCLKKTDIVKSENIDESIKKLLFSSTIDILSPAQAVINLQNTQASDLLFVYYMNNGATQILVKGTDYEVQNTDSNNAQLFINSSLISSANSIYVKGIHIGI